MNKIAGKARGLLKGTPTGVLVSIAIHAALLFGLGAMVVFKLVSKDEPAFEPPPPVKRTKMKLKKPVVKAKQTAKPRPSKQITTKSLRGMPDLSLPALSSAGSGLSGGIGGFDLMPDLSEMSFFGGSKSISTGNDFVGTFYSFRYDRSGDLLYEGRQEWAPLFVKFLENDWNPRVFSRLYRSPRKLYATQFLVPAVMTSQGPEQFGIELAEFDPIDWLVHYKGKIASKEGGRFRFWGVGDFLLVRVNQKLVFCDFFQEERDEFIPTEIWPKYSTGDKEKEKDGRRTWRLISRAGNRGGVWIGEWFDLEPGEAVDMEVITGEGGGAYFTCALLVEQEGGKYEKNETGMPILPIFKTSEMSQGIKNQILYKLIRHEMDLESELMFNVY